MLPSLIENSIISNFNEPVVIFAPENDKEIYHYCVKNEINAVFEKCKYPDPGSDPVKNDSKIRIRIRHEKIGSGTTLLFTLNIRAYPNKST